ncbi:MAG: hypothetical protein Q9169_004127 [Polycauliona sp. 2 TL-2023]
MSLLFYRRPDFVSKLPGPMDKSKCQIYVDRTQKHRKAIPPELSFDNILQNKALPPCGLQDFMDYMVYVSHDAENLQFWIWLNAYTTRFYKLPPSEQALSPPWSAVEGLLPTGNIMPSRPQKPSEKSKFGAQIDFDHPSIVPGAVQGDNQSVFSGTANTARSTADSVEEANAAAGLKWQSFSMQPYRSEIDRVISHYIATDSPRELNLSHKTRTFILHALQHTTHPSAFSTIRELVEDNLRGQSHPNFVRWSICNGNQPKVFLVRNLGIAHVLLALLLAVLLILSRTSRWWRIFCFPLFFLGFSIGIAAYKGLCLIIHTGHARNLRPWEQFGDSASLDSFDTDNEAGFSTDNLSHRTSDLGKRGRSMDTFGTSNSFDHEPWVEQYQKKPLLKRMYPKNTWIQDETIRILQDRIVWQSHLWSLMASVPLTVAIVAVPMAGVL